MELYQIVHFPFVQDHQALSTLGQQLFRDACKADTLKLIIQGAGTACWVAGHAGLLHLAQSEEGLVNGGGLFQHALFRLRVLHTLATSL